jgi:hypothetical protein
MAMPDLKTELAKVALPTQRVEGQKPTRTTLTTSPVYTAKLADKIGTVEAARRIGFGDSTIRNAITRDSISMVAEIAAKGVLAELEAAENPGSTDVYVAARIPREKAAAFKAVADAMGIKMRILS